MRDLFTPLFLAFVIAATNVVAAPLQDALWTRAAGSVTSDPSVAAAKQYTHVIVGCGLAGLTAAVRLSQDSANTVLCLEAGGDSRTDSRVVSLTAYGQAFGTGLDWNFATTKQKSAGNNVKHIQAGKTLGGSTAINGGAYTRGSQEAYNAIGDLGNDGWSWNDLLPYMEKSETVNKLNSRGSKAGFSIDSSVHGSNGPVDVSFPPKAYIGPQQPAFIAGLKQTLGVTKIDDLGSGNNDGTVAYTPVWAKSTGNLIRASAATAYLSPIENSRSNLVVLTGYRGIKMNWTSGSTARATGVVAQSSSSGPQEVFSASKEVIVAAGAIRSPLFLEASGVGDAAILKKIGVSQKVNLPGVGRNLIEQTKNSIGGGKGNYDFNGDGPSNVIAYPNIYQLMSNASDVRNWVESNMDKWAQDQVNLGSVVSKDAILKQYRITNKLIFDDNVGVAEFFGDSGFPSSGFGIDMWQTMPYSRGSVHSTDASGFSAPTLSPNYFSSPFDMQVTVAALRGGRKTLASQAMKSALGETEQTPGFSLIPNGDAGGRYDRWASWVLSGNGGNGFSSVAHPIASCAMLPQADGGVVSNKFKVYGTENVRVIDASVLPMQVGHLSSTLYGIAEKAAAIIGAGQ